MPQLSAPALWQPHSCVPLQLRARHEPTRAHAQTRRPSRAPAYGLACPARMLALFQLVLSRSCSCAPSPLLAQPEQTRAHAQTRRPSRAPAQALACPARISEYSAVALWRLQIVAPHELTRARRPIPRPVAAPRRARTLRTA